MKFDIIKIEISNNEQGIMNIDLKNRNLTICKLTIRPLHYSKFVIQYSIFDAS